MITDETHESIQVNGDFFIFYDMSTVVPILDRLGVIGNKIRQLIWNKAYDQTLTDYTPCGKDDEFRFFIIKSPSIKVSFMQRSTGWIVYGLTPYESK